jgi:hypothetical protein
MQRYLSKRVNAQHPPSFVQQSRQYKFLVRDGNEHVNAHRDRALALYRGRQGTEDALDAQVLLDPAEKPIKANRRRKRR